MLKHIATLSTLALLAACGSNDPGTEKWCEAKKAVPKSEWSMEDAKTYAANCVVDSTTIGSEAWCEKMKEKDTGDLTVEAFGRLGISCEVPSV